MTGWLLDTNVISEPRKPKAERKVFGFGGSEDPKHPQKTFFEPRAFSLAQQGPGDSEVALEFHEALHGFLQTGDPDLQQFLGCTVGYDETRDITTYLQQVVGSVRASSSAPTPNGLLYTCLGIENHKIPANENVCPAQ